MTPGADGCDLGDAGVESDAAARDRIADERDDLADEREARLEARELRTEARETGQAERSEQTGAILAGAEQRDDQADARDVTADKRDAAASLHSFMNDSAPAFDAGLTLRRCAALDRVQSKADRGSAASDRSKLAQDD